MQTIPESPSLVAELQAEIAALRSQVDYVVSVMAAMCREARTPYLMAAGESPQPQRHLRAVR